ncbi:MAG: hypothetical protein H8E17_12905 [Deltaproteobacteria bacterium]|nr:hypothetical protein [Deltaproteobacteria bacterium]
MNLYKIDEETLSAIIYRWLQELGSSDGKYELVEKVLTAQHDYPLKVVFSKEKGQISVITAYPLNRGLGK